MDVNPRSLLIALVLIEAAISTIGVTATLLYAMERRENTLFWYGFAVPYGPVLGIPQAILIALIWRQLA